MDGHVCPDGPYAVLSIFEQDCIPKRYRQHKSIQIFVIVHVQGILQDYHSKKLSESCIHGRAQVLLSAG